jgi:hypothetical protein
MTKTTLMNDSTPKAVTVACCKPRKRRLEICIKPRCVFGTAGRPVLRLQRTADVRNRKRQDDRDIKEPCFEGAVNLIENCFHDKVLFRKRIAVQPKTLTGPWTAPGCVSEALPL